MPPQITFCPGDITASTALGTSGTTVTWQEPMATDNSGIANLISRSLPPGAFFQIGVTTVTYVFQDPSLNTDFCTFDIYVSAGKIYSLPMFCIVHLN